VTKIDPEKILAKMPDIHKGSYRADRIREVLRDVNLEELAADTWRVEPGSLGDNPRVAYGAEMGMPNRWAIYIDGTARGPAAVAATAKLVAHLNDTEYKP